MSAATIPLSPTLPLSPSQRTSKPWQPSERDRMIFRWVRFDGMTQQWVARELNLHQTSVSRVLQRYERWIARGGPASEGALTREELLRYQHWLTFERNEHIIASALRLADELTRPFDTSSSTITTNPQSAIPNPQFTRIENKVIDRSGTPCRYLRLAFRVSEAQLKLLKDDELTPLDPLLEEDLDLTLDEELDKALPTISRILNPQKYADLDPDPDPAPNPAPNLPTSPPTAVVDVSSAVVDGSPAVVDGSPDPSTSPTAGLPPVVKRSPDPSTPPTAGLPNQQTNPITTLELSPHHPPTHKTHTPKTARTLDPIDTYIPNAPSENSSSPDAYTPSQPQLVPG